MASIFITIRRSCLIMGLFIIFGMQTAQSESGFMDFGARANVELGDGEPANDMLGFGFYTHYQFNNGVLLGFAVDSMGYDFEGPAKIVGITQDTSLNTIDAASQATNITAWYEQRRNSWYWRAGLGVGLVDVDDQGGPVEGGGTFNITTDPGTEYLLLGGGGYRYKFSQNWTLDGYAGIIHHFADWKVKDTVSGNTGTVSDYTDWSFQIGVDYSF